MKTHRFIRFAAVSLFVGATLLSGCANLNDPYGTGGYGGNYGGNYGGGYGGNYGGGYAPPPPYYGGGGYYGNNYDAQREQRELERERRRLEEERRRLEQERRLQQNQPPAQPPISRPVDRCPPGFSPSEQKCSPQERSNGCRDIRLPSGLGCVSR